MILCPYRVGPVPIRFSQAVRSTRPACPGPTLVDLAAFLLEDIMHILEQIEPGKVFTALEVLESQVTNIMSHLWAIENNLSDEKKECIECVRGELRAIRGIISKFADQENKRNKNE